VGFSVVEVRENFWEILSFLNISLSKFKKRERKREEIFKKREREFLFK
jgi:hypothetical protein